MKTFGKKPSRRQFIGTTAAVSAAALAAPYVRTAHAAGKLSVGLWDHWVPGANDATRTLIEEWAAKEKVEVTIDFITSQGRKILLTQAAWVGSRYPAVYDVVSGSIRRQIGGDERRRRTTDCAKRRGERHG